MVFTAFRRQLRKRSERGNVMWFVLYCPNQKETEVIRSCMRHLTAQALTDAFVLTYDRLRRYEGAWHMERRPIFPDCIFLESEDGECLVKELDQYRKEFHITEPCPAPVPIKKEEEEFLQGLCGREHHSALSKGYIRNGRTYVTEGPLVGKEGLIRKIDRHKRLAEIRMPDQSSSPNRFRKMQVGLEIVEKEP